MMLPPIPGPKGEYIKVNFSQKHGMSGITTKHVN